MADNHDYNQRKPELVLSHNLNAQLKRGCKKNDIASAFLATPELVSEIISAHSYTCCLTGAVLPATQLSLARVDARLPFSPANAAPFDRSLSRSIRGGVFPAWAAARVLRPAAGGAEAEAPPPATAPCDTRSTEYIRSEQRR